MAANACQVGGRHYKTGGIEVWDFVEANGIGFLEGTAIKYIARWNTKGGVEDLRKAAHYVDKLIELSGQYRRKNRSYNISLYPASFDEFVQCIQAEYPEAHIIAQLATWQILTELHQCRNEIKKLIEKEL